MTEFEIMESVKRMPAKERESFWGFIDEIAQKHLDASDYPSDFKKEVQGYEMILWLEPGDMVQCWQKLVDLKKGKKSDRTEESEKGDSDEIQH